MLGLIEAQVLLSFFFFGLFAFSRATPEAYGGSQARGPIKLWIPAYTRTTATPHLRHICDLYHSSRQRRIPNPLIEAVDLTHNLMVLSWILFHCTSMGNPILSLFLCMVWRCVLVSLIYMQLSSFPSTTCWRDCLFPILYSCLLCWRLIDHRCLGLFLGCLFCHTDVCYVCFFTSTTLSWLL